MQLVLGQRLPQLHYAFMQVIQLCAKELIPRKLQRCPPTTFPLRAPEQQASASTIGSAAACELERALAAKAGNAVTLANEGASGGTA